MLRSFANKITEDIFHGNHSHTVREAFPLALVYVAERKLDMLNSLGNFEHLKQIPANRNGKVCRDTKGRYSMPIDDRWCIAFQWNGEGSDEVEIKVG